MRKILIAAAVMAALPAFAADLGMGTQLGTTMDEIKATLTDMGYEVRKLEMDDGKIEAYAVKDGQMSEMYVDPATGQVVDLDTN
ncbi:PepSY domain-containing protein [Roseovarius nanhaiticus]|uniref:PepSY domain-containing protein n=1 Tax=Roseovarius nanhaiticus TaxID=573024 RepID=UPI0024920BCF|nr:PepSY domain-containing protein [Roseovarius nanhaiticus]